MAALAAELEASRGSARQTEQARDARIRELLASIAEMRKALERQEARAKELGQRLLLAEKGVPFEEIDVTAHPERRDELDRAVGGHATLPQVFIGARRVGGYEELQELDRTRGVRSAVAEGDRPSG